MTVNLGKRKRKGTSIGVEEKDKRSSLFRLYTNTSLKIENVAERISTSVEASSAPPTNLVPTIAKTMKMVKECGGETRNYSNIAEYPRRSTRRSSTASLSPRTSTASRSSRRALRTRRIRTTSPRISSRRLRLHPTLPAVLVLLQDASADA
uniref:Uncharacterized protein n=1 Tax=Setaria viridis TaxID=4556 RepID=A0A4V6D9Z0_SETVI|nr:hypothetical protein SEVIR_3G289651v2 [Setaria viridis]